MYNYFTLFDKHVYKKFRPKLQPKLRILKNYFNFITHFSMINVIDMK